jgi:hypothetical protein
MKKLEESWKKTVAAREQERADLNPGWGYKKEPGDARAMQHYRAEAERELHDAGTQFLKQHGFTAGAKKCGARKIPGL